MHYTSIVEDDAIVKLKLAAKEFDIFTFKLCFYIDDWEG